jgi:hypothetical protein
MKNRNPILHVLSVAFLGLFIFLGIASYDDFDEIADHFVNDTTTDKEYLGDGVEKHTEFLADSSTHYTRVRTGKTDEYGSFHGTTLVEAITWPVDSTHYVLSEAQINYVHGEAHGIFPATFKRIPPGTIILDTICYYMDQRIPCEDWHHRQTRGLSAYDILKEQYPLWWYDIKAFLFEENFIEAYMDTMQAMIDSLEFSVSSFDDYYEDAIDKLKSTEFETLSNFNNDLFILNILRLMKKATFRLAVFDSYLTDIGTIREIFDVRYPGYLSSLNWFGVTTPQFDTFCHVFDSLMVGYGPLDINDDLFPDSVDTRMYRAFNTMDSLDTRSGLSWNTLSRRELFREFRYYPNPKLKNRAGLVNTRDIIINYSIAQFFFKADPIRESLREANNITHQEYLPIRIATSFIENLPGNKAEIEAYVFSDGGAPITERGIAWGIHENPSIYYNSEIVEGELGFFSVIIPDLIPGQTYFARSWVRNSDGRTGYSNNVRFEAEEIVSVKDDLNSDNDQLQLFPNPSSDIVNVRIIEKYKSLSALRMFDVAGRMVHEVDLNNGKISPGLVQFDISGMSEGLYICIFYYEDGMNEIKKFEIMR